MLRYIVCAAMIAAPLQALACDTVQVEINMRWCFDNRNHAKGIVNLANGAEQRNEGLVRRGYEECQIGHGSAQDAGKRVGYLSSCPPSPPWGYIIARRIQGLPP